MQQTELTQWLAATHLHGIGLAKLHTWLNLFSTITNLFTASIEELKSAGLNSKEIQALKNPDWFSVEQDLKWHEKENCHLIPLSHACYPRLLREISNAPLVLYVKGQLTSFAQPQVAIVGTRNPTPIGRELAEQFAYALSRAGLGITSGLALGIDAAGHQGTLAANGVTIAVTGTGLNQIYPASHRSLAEKIIEKGALVSEFSPDTPATAKNFPRRNRIISGLSMGVIVIEAALRSGSLITARFAVEQGREVFALPGSIHNPLARGCHQLIRQGAKLVETAEDILEELATLIHVVTEVSAENAHANTKKTDIKHQHLLRQMGHEVVNLDTLCLRSGLTVSEVSSMLLLLELRGHVQIVPGGYLRSST